MTDQPEKLSNMHSDKPEPRVQARSHRRPSLLDRVKGKSMRKASTRSSGTRAPITNELGLTLSDVAMLNELADSSIASTSTMTNNSSFGLHGSKGSMNNSSRRWMFGGRRNSSISVKQQLTDVESDYNERLKDNSSNRRGRGTSPVARANAPGAPPLRGMSPFRRRKSIDEVSICSTNSHGSLNGGTSKSGKRKTKIGRALRRMSLGASVPKEHLVFYEGRETGSIILKKEESVASVRARIVQEIPKMDGKEFSFWYAKHAAYLVELEDEHELEISQCVDDESILCIATVAFVNATYSVNFAEEDLRDLVPPAEAVVRHCFRFLENNIFNEDATNTENFLPDMTKTCKRFIKDIARATVDARRTAEHPDHPNINWITTQENLQQLEDLLVRAATRKGFEKWLFYRNDQEQLVEVIGLIQREFFQSPNLSEDHPVFFFRMRKVDHSADHILSVLHVVTLDELLQDSNEGERAKLSQILRISEDELLKEIVAQKEGKLVTSLLGSTVSTKDTVLLTHAEIKAMLAPNFDLQEQLIEEEVAQFFDGTREWAFEVFDRWVQDTRAPHRAFIMTGQAGFGKTCFSAQVTRSRPASILGYFFCRHDDGRFRQSKTMLLMIVYQLTLRSPRYKNIVRVLLADKGLTRKELLSSAFSIRAIFEMLLEEPLLEIDPPAKGKLAIVVDGIDDGKEGLEGRNEILDTIQKMFLRLPTWIVFLFTTKPRLNVLKRLRRFNALVVEPRGEQNEDDMKLYFNHALSRFNFSDPRDKIELSAMISENANGVFFYAEVMALKLADCHDLESSYEVTMQKMESLFTRDFSAICSDNKEFFWNVVKLCMVAARPLDEEVICDVIGCHQEDLTQLLSLTLIFFKKSGSMVKFVHKVSKDWLLNLLANTTQEKSSSTSRRNRRQSFTGSAHKDVLQRDALRDDPVSVCHAFVARQIERLIHDSTESEGVSPLSRDYLLHHGVQHLALGGMSTEAKELILSPAWLITHAGDLEGIVEACELLAEGDQVLALLARAVSMASDAARSEPRQLIGQLVGRLIAVTDDGHGNDIVRIRMSRFINDLRSHDYGFNWFCPVGPTWDQAEQPFLHSMHGHDGPVQSVAWHCGGRKCASGSWDFSIKIWDTLTAQCGQTLTGHTNTVWSVDWEPSGQRVASGSLDKTVRVWDTLEEVCVLTLEGHTDSVWTVRWSRDGKAVASGSKDATIRIWDVSNGTCTSVLSGYDGLIYSIVWEGGMNSRICSGSTDNIVRIWDTEKQVCVEELKGHRDWVRSVDWCSTGRHIISASADTTVRVWDAETFECEHVLMGHSDTVWSVSKNCHGQFIVSGSSDGTVRVWNSTTGRSEQVLNCHKGAVWSVAFSPNSNHVLSGSADQTIGVWDASVGLSTESITGHMKPIWCIDVSKDGHKIVSGSADKTARLWNARLGICEKVFSGHSGPVFSVKFSNDCKLLATSSSDNSAAIYRISTGDRKLHLVGHTASVWSVAWSLDDAVLYTGSKDMTVRIWDAQNGCSVGVLNGHEKDIKGLSISSDGKRLASCSTDATIRVWNLESQQCERVLQKKKAACLSVEWHPKLNYLIAAGYTDGAVCVWDADEGEQDVDFLPGHARRANSVGWSPDGDHVVSASSDKEVRTWNMSTSQCEAKIKASTGQGVFGVVWRDDSIVSCGADKSIRLFDPSNSRCKSVMAGENRNSLGILDMALSSDGKFAASGSRNYTVQIWNAESGLCEKTLKGHTNWVHSVFFDVSGKQVLSKSDDGTSRLWDIGTGECLLVNEDVDALPEGFVPQTKAPMGNMKEKLDADTVGVVCDKAVVQADRACGWIGKQVYFFTMQKGASNVEEDSFSIL